MEIPKEIIDKAGDGGYDYSKPLEYGQSRLLDPLFWQALGKACGWRDKFYSYYKTNTGREEFNGHWVPVETWLECPENLRKQQELYPNAHYIRTHNSENPEYKMNTLRFHEINLTEGWDNAIKYLQDLIN